MTVDGQGKISIVETLSGWVLNYVINLFTVTHVHIKTENELLELKNTSILLFESGIYLSLIIMKISKIIDF